MRINVRLSAEHAAQLTQIQEQTQASVSEIIRRALEVIITRFARVPLPRTKCCPPQDLLDAARPSQTLGPPTNPS